MIRESPIYISIGVWKVLRVMSKAESAPHSLVSVDEIADRILSHALAGCVPRIADRLALIRKQELELEESVRKENA